MLGASHCGLTRTLAYAGEMPSASAIIQGRASGRSRFCQCARARSCSVDDDTYRAVPAEYLIQRLEGLGVGYASGWMTHVLRFVAALVRWLRRSPAEREAEIVYLRQQLIVLKRAAPARQPRWRDSITRQTPKCTSHSCLMFFLLSRCMYQRCACGVRSH